MKSIDRVTFVGYTQIILTEFDAFSVSIAVMGPLMLAIGVHPSVSSATTACMILYTSFTATSSFVVFGLLEYDYAVACVTMGFTATLLGQVFMSYLLHRYQRHSLIAFSVGLVIAIATVCMSFESIWNLKSGGSHESRGLCSGSARVH